MEGQRATLPSWAALGGDRLPFLARMGDPGASVRQTGTRLGSPFTWRSPSASSDPSGWGSLVWVCLFMPQPRPPAPHSGLCAGLRCQGHSPAGSLPWAGFVPALGLVPSPGNWDKPMALQGHPEDHSEQGAAPGPALMEWGRGQRCPKREETHKGKVTLSAPTQQAAGAHTLATLES